MNWLDIIAIIVIIGGAFAGLMNGLIKMVFSLAGLIVGVVLAGRFYLALADRLGFISNEKAAHILAFIIIFLAVLVVVTLLGILLTRIVSAVLLGWINRLAGAVLGAVMGALFLAAVLAIWAKYVGAAGAIQDSALAPVLLQYFPAVLSLLPAEFDTVRDFFD